MDRESQRNYAHFSTIISIIEVEVHCYLEIYNMADQDNISVPKLVETPFHQELKLPDVTKVINLYKEHLRGLWWSIF